MQWIVDNGQLIIIVMLSTLFLHSSIKDKLLKKSEKENSLRHRLTDSKSIFVLIKGKPITFQSR